MVEEDASLRVQRDDRLHVFGAKFKTEDVEVLDHSLFPHGFWDNNDPSLCQPAQYYLRHGFLVFPGDRKQQLVLEDVVYMFSVQDRVAG